MKNIFKTSFILLIISVVVALILATVNMLTMKPIALNQQKERNAAMRSIFPEMEIVETVKENFDKSISSVERVMSKDNQFIGYAAEVTQSGFGGDIDIIVGIDKDFNIIGIEIMAIAETPGVGLKVTEDRYLSDYIGLSDNITFENSPVDAITGATISSKAVLSAVNIAVGKCKAVLSHQIHDVETIPPGDSAAPETLPKEGDEQII